MYLIVIPLVSDPPNRRIFRPSGFLSLSVTPIYLNAAHAEKLLN
jgi:hypothetical protein